MKRFIVTLLLVILTFPTGLAEDLSSLPGLTQEGDHIVGSMDTGRGFPLLVDMPVPKSIAGPVKQYEMRRIEITKPEISALLKGRTQPAKTGETWMTYAIDQTEFRQFLYKEDASTYATFYPPFSPLPLVIQTQDPMYELANQRAQELLDDWSIAYEFPFYQVCNAARGADVSLRGVPIHTGSDMKEYLLSINSDQAIYEYDYDSTNKMFDDEYTFVRARQQLDGIPFAIGDIKSPNYRWDNPQYDEGIYALLQFNSRGEIVFADASNLHEVVKENGAPQPIHDWQECLAMLSKNTKFLDGRTEAKVIDVELCYAINGKHITYPVWQFMVEFKQDADSALQQYLCSAIYVDACTGKPL